MAEPEAKRVKTEYELIYWPGIPGRGEVVRLLFEDAGVAYIDTAKGDNAVPTTLSYMDSSNLGDEKNPPVFAPPVLKHGELVINQLSNILLYLAPKLGLGPASGDGVYHLNSIALTILDGLCVEVHDTHHPIATHKYYEDQKEEAKLRAKAFREERLPKYLTYVQRLLDAKTSGEGCLDGTKFAFPQTVEKLKKSGKYDGVFKLYDAVKERPNIKAYLESDKRIDYSDGIWRHYPELEEDE
ncbi:hypothetical protein TrVFT333_006916 [Trichoderma virens FT-333]|nr:hypothetical protein TrVFT333_006916 [Trichoderma virens FT-333]